MNVLYPLRRAVSRHGDRIATIDGDRRLTWKEFEYNVRRGASALAGCGLSPGDRVAVLAGNSADYLELYFSSAIAGLIIVPVNIRWSLEDMIYALTDSSAAALVVDERFLEHGRQIVGRMPGIRLIDQYAARRNAADPCVALIEPDGDEVAGLFYTSGTTGGPKGVMLTHRNLYAHMTAMVLEGTAPQAVYLHAAPMFHAADVALLFAVTNQGGTHTFLEVFDPEAFLRTVERERVGYSVLVPTMINMIVNLPVFDRYDVSSLIHILYGASPMPLPLLRRAREKLGCNFIQAYGMTEMSPVMTLLKAEDHDLENTDGAFVKVKSAGRPMHGVEVRVVDDGDRDVTVGEVGEIIGRGEARMKGYWNRPEINREVLRGGWMHTGDLGAFDADGYLYVLDRKKDMIKTGGENVYTPEVEAMLLSHPELLECSIIGVADEKWGERIRAIVVAREGARLDEATLLAWCRERLTHFKCPASVVFLPSLPKGGTGKVQKAVLRRLHGSVIGSS